MAIFVTSVAQTGDNFQNQRYFVFRRLQYDISITCLQHFQEGAVLGITMTIANPKGNGHDPCTLG